MADGVLQNLGEYARVFKRLEDFRNEEQDWDGYGGQPASDATCAEVTTFLQAAIDLTLPQPSLVMSTSGAVSAVWQDSSLYITINFCGRGEYAYLVCSRSGTLKHSGIELNPGFIGRSITNAISELSR